MDHGVASCTTQQADGTGNQTAVHCAVMTPACGWHVVTRFRIWILSTTVLLTVVAASVVANWQRSSFRRTSDRSDYLNWTVDEDFQNDVFTFVRIRDIPTASGPNRFGTRWPRIFYDVLCFILRVSD